MNSPVGTGCREFPGEGDGRGPLAAKLSEEGSGIVIFPSLSPLSVGVLCMLISGKKGFQGLILLKSIT